MRPLEDLVSIYMPRLDDCKAIITDDAVSALTAAADQDPSSKTFAQTFFSFLTAELLTRDRT